MRCSIVSIGTEITKGFILDSNSNYLSRELGIIGADVRFILSVGDNKEEIMRVLKFAYENSDIIITTGGLGPTADDLTRECVGELLGVEFILSETILNKIREKFLKYNNGEMPEINKRQAYIPKQGIVIDNEIGSAPGYIITKDKKFVISLPGVPQEMKTMYRNFLKNYISSNILKRNKKEFFVKILGMPESKVDEIVSSSGIKEYNTIADYGVVDTIFYFEPQNYDEEKSFIINFLNERINSQGVVMFFSEELSDIPSIVKSEFTKRKLTLSTAESMTGGYLSQLLTSVPGATSYFLGGIISYSDSSKISALRIKEETINKYYATSMETTIEMAKNSLEIFKSDVSVAITGIAGPTTDASRKEIGTVYIVSMLKDGNYLSKELKLFGNREKIRSSASLKAIELTIKLIQSNEVLWGR
ncbi:MAG: CinA family nicotinamide mononucleotide deamidase-related protein [Brevinematales bacterium]|nr:CinA family nicotinamide mononucleotide deamidase-related protein [Brevinematales bacterium]